MKKNLKIRFEDVDRGKNGLSKQPEFFVELLSRKYNVTVLNGGSEEPDVLFFSCWGEANVKWTRCLRIYFSGERFYPDFNMCDYAVGLTNIGTSDRFFRFPHYVFYNGVLRKYENMQPDADAFRLVNREFCSAVVTDPYRSPIFFDIFNRLSEYKPVASGGGWNNTVGGPVPDKLEFIKNYKFNIAFENIIADNYVTEKIVEAFAARTVPIYWGSSSVKREFGEGSYINILDFDTIDRAIDYIKKVDNDDELYMQILCRRAQMPYTYDEWCDRLLDFLYNAIESDNRIFDSRLNYVYNKKYNYYLMHTSFIGTMYRKYKRTLYSLQDLWRTKIR